eukprot:EG_transcript_61387
MAALPNDVWEIVADFLQSPVVSHLCSRNWTALRWRHMIMFVSPANLARAWAGADLPQKIQFVQAAEHIQSLTLVGSRLEFGSLHPLSTLGALPSLTALVLDLRR